MAADWMEEELLPLPVAGRGAVPLVSQFRGTWLTTSVRALEKRGLLQRYVRALPSSDRDAVLYCSALSWVSTDLVVRHYGACDRLQISDETLVEIGAEVTQRVHAASLALGRSLASASGVTPWTILARLDKLWSRVMIGGAVAVKKIGPKDARIELLGFPLAHLRYNRVATRGIVRGVLGMFCEAVTVQEMPALCTQRTLGYRAQWV